MQPFTTILSLVVMALTLTLCTAAPQAKPTHESSSNVENMIGNTFPDTIADSSITNGTASTNTQNKCYDWDSSEKWKDVGGQHSEFVNQAVYSLCQLIAIDAYKGFSSGNTVSSIILQYPNNLYQDSCSADGYTQIKHCKEVRGGSHGKDYDRSIGISLRYMGPQLKFNHITAGYCNDRMAQPMACGAGGEFDQQVDNPELPKPWVSDRWEAIADPNSGDCRSNGYNSDL